MGEYDLTELVEFLNMYPNYKFRAVRNWDADGNTIGTTVCAYDSVGYREDFIDLDTDGEEYLQVVNYLINTGRVLTIM